MLETQWHLFKICTFVVHSPCNRHRYQLLSHCDLFVRSQSCRRPYCTAFATLRRPQCALIRTPGDSVCFGHAESERRQSEFYAITARLLAMELCFCGDTFNAMYCDLLLSTSAFCSFQKRRENALVRYCFTETNLATHCKLHTFQGNIILCCQKPFKCPVISITSNAF